MIITTLVLLCWTVASMAAPARAEVYGGQKPLALYKLRHPEMRRQGGRMGMPVIKLSNLLAMSYLQNMAIYARLLRDQVLQRGEVDGDFAREVTALIWRNFEMLDCYRRERLEMTQNEPKRDHSSMASTAANAPSEYLALREIGAQRGPLTPPSPVIEGKQMTDMMRRMEACMALLGAHLIELERETGAACPNPKWTLEHTNAILRLIDEMSSTRAKATRPNQR
ncbi:MAG: hypothetical protein J2P21_09540 [Chloracidobacterium sp.]|nr:hypothetical protein [Chloracidobacterium sp.]